ncbi:helix-turn-helix domain-containing protein [Phosphitispora fastidiosa]|uniref:helix-turn-helix domain-containing protein n=1 Tax=Phosphitispora fastidiosa TaxID=2837202 RepID=UPI001E4BCC22|nr:helix-turn-helix transcriptional regulator [Phosphitispora fastidiosa]MBU7006353.1 transcriptional regulator with XRE-family HTH domain [Phosphitispora fastidiosa]
MDKMKKCFLYEFSDEIRISLGKVIRRHRLLQDIKIKELTEKAEISETYLTEVERGAYNPSLKTMARLAVALNKPLWELLKEAEEEYLALKKAGDGDPDNETGNI